MPNRNDFPLTRWKYPVCRASPLSVALPLTDCPVYLSGIPCFTQRRETTKSAGLETMLQSFAWTSNSFFALGQCHNRHSLIWDVRTHYSLIAGMSRTFICGTNGLRFKPQQSITPFFAFTPSKINVHLHLGLNLHQTPRILQKCFDLLWITYKLIIDWSDQGSSSGWWLTVYTIPFRFTENERTIPQQLTITSDRQLSMF